VPLVPKIKCTNTADNKSCGQVGRRHHVGKAIGE
jgi:ribosomal protein L32